VWFHSQINSSDTFPFFVKSIGNKWVHLNCTIGQTCCDNNNKKNISYSVSRLYNVSDNSI
jgi:hypothetical protein